MTREGDLISRQAVIDACEQSINILEAVDRIMDLPSVKQEPSGDAISRQAVLKAMCDASIPIIYKGKPSFVVDYVGVIETVPSVNPLEAVEQDKSKNNVLEQLKNLIDEFNMQDLSFDEMSGFECKVLELLEQDYICDTCKQEPKYCDRNICVSNEYNGIGCNECEVTKSQEPKTGHWFVDERPESDREVICSNCEQPIFKYHKLDFDYRPKFCPNCGVKMVEPQERSKE